MLFLIIYMFYKLIHFCECSTWLKNYYAQNFTDIRLTHLGHGVQQIVFFI